MRLKRDIMSLGKGINVYAATRSSLESVAYAPPRVQSM